jgi:thiamine pyrophosphate-dependent acetolactate synthase large subunit-like protein
MKNYLITYELYDQYDHAHFLAALKQFNGWTRLHKNAVIISAKAKPQDIMDYLSQYLTGQDKIFIVEVGRNATWAGLSKEVSNWIKKYL